MVLGFLDGSNCLGLRSGAEQSLSLCVERERHHTSGLIIFHF